MLLSHKAWNGAVILEIGSTCQYQFVGPLAHLYNLIPYQRRALHAGHCGVEVEGGRLPTSDWMLTLQILTSGGYQGAAETPHH